MNNTRKFEAIYAEVPDIPNCKGLCHASCGPIMGSKWEMDRLAQHGEFKEQGISCPYLTESKRCSAYDQRPLICRLYGAAEGLECEFGCMPEGGLISMARVNELMAESQKVGGPSVGVGIDLFDQFHDAVVQCLRDGMTRDEFFALIDSAPQNTADTSSTVSESASTPNTAKDGP